MTMNAQLSTTIVTAASPTFNPMMKATMKLCLITPMLALNQSKLTLTNTIHPIMAIAPNLNKPPALTETMDSPTRSSSPQAGSKQQHHTDDEDDENDSDIGMTNIHVSKAPEIHNKTTQLKASNYDEFGKELILAAANIYCALLASQGAFLIPSVELKLIKKAWKLVNAESGVKPLTLTPSIVIIVSISSNIYLFYFYLSVHLD